jgi:hypothetical protein
MSTMKIAVDGELIFNWDGDEAAVQNILERFPHGARSVGVTPEALADASIMHLNNDSFLSADSVGQEMQMMGVIWRILTSETGDAEHPGKVSTYAANTDFDVNIEIGAGRFTMHVNARSRFDS